MAEFIVGVGADISVLQLKLVQAENSLKQFEAQARKSTDIGQLGKLNTDIYNLKNTISGLQTQMSSVSRPTGDATQSLINFSRIAQDAPYGIIGIANNLNPMLESFQRLAATEKGVTGALKAMVSGLAGPAGIGVALGVVSSLAVVFAKDISEFFKGPTEELKKFREELNKINQDLYKIVGEAQAHRSVGISLVNVLVGGDISQQEEALKKLKKLYSDNKDIQDAKIGNDRAYYTHLVNMASIQEAALGKEKNSTKQLEFSYSELKRIEGERNNELKKLDQGIGVGFFKAEAGGFQKQVDKQKADINERYNKLLDPIKSAIKQAEKLNGEFISAATGFETPDKKGGSAGAKGPSAESEMNKMLNMQLAAIKARALQAKELGLGTVDTFQESDQKENKERKRLAEIKAFADSKLKDNTLGAYLAGITPGLLAKNKAEESAEKEKAAALADALEKQKKFADFMANEVTGAIKGVWNAMKSGESVIDALGNAFLQLAEDIGFAILKAEILAAIQAAMGPAGAVGGAGGGGFLSMIAKLLGGGLASGGIVTSPTLTMVGEGNEHEAVMPLSKLGSMMNNTFNAGAMSGNGGGGGNGQFVLKGNDLVLALQRSNYNLNLRRG